MSDLSSFYGGRRGFSFNMVKRFDGYDIPTTTYCKSYYATSDGDNFIITDAEHGGNVAIDNGGYLIKRDRYNYLNYNTWVLREDNGSVIPHSGSGTYHFPTKTAEGLVQCFNQGINSLNEVGYGEYVIIDTVTNLDDYNSPDNGSIYRRGLGTQGVYDAEFIGQITGTQGGTLVNIIVDEDGHELPRERFIKVDGALHAEDDPTNHRTVLSVDKVTPESIGIGFGVSNESTSTTARTTSIQNYVLTKNGIVAVRFEGADLPAGTTLNISGTGAKSIKYKNNDLVRNVVKAGDTVTFVYDGSAYHILSIDKIEGHVIQDSANVEYTNRSKLQFTDAKVNDDSANNRTQIDVIRGVMTLADFDNASNLPDGIYGIEGDDEDQAVIDASMVAYGQGTVKDALDNSSQITVDDTLSTTSTNPVQNKVITARLDEVFQSVSNGKALIASAITDKGVPTQADATFAVMAENISQISGGGQSGELADIFDGASTISLSAVNGITLISSSVADRIGTASLSEASSGFEGFNIALKNLQPGINYDLSFKFHVTSGTWFTNPVYRFGYMITNINRDDYNNYNSWPENLTRDLEEHEYNINFIAGATTMYLSFNICGFADGITNYFTIKDLQVRRLGSQFIKLTASDIVQPISFSSLTIGSFTENVSVEVEPEE